MLDREPDRAAESQRQTRKWPGSPGPGRASATTARTFEDIAELDFCRPGQEPTEIDIIAFADGRLIIGEAKCVATLGANKESGQAIANLLDISDFLGADEILLATTAPGPWPERDTYRLMNGGVQRSWRFGQRRPSGC